MKRLAIAAAMVGFFSMAFAGWISDVPVFVCGLRATAGAVAMYILIRLAGTLVIRIIASIAVKVNADEDAVGKEQS